MANATAAKPRRTAVIPATPEQVRAITREVGDNVLVERHRELDVLLRGALGRLNIHLQGPPGSAKSLGLREFCKRIGVGSDVPHFEKTIHPQMPADAIIGGYDMELLLRESRFERKVQGYLPGARTALLDEITRANGPVTDALLPLMNTRERLYEANGQMLKAPLLFLVTASNFMPDPNDPQLGAFVDRFTLMCRVQYVKSDESFKELLRRSQARRRGEARAGVNATVTLEAFMASQDAVAQVDCTEDAYLDAIAQLRRAAANAGVVVSDRRWDELSDVTRAAAWLAGRDVAKPEDLAACEDGLWRVEAEIPTARELVRPFLSTFESEAMEKRAEAQPHIDAHERNRPLVEGTPAGERLDREVSQQLSDAGRGLHHAWKRVRESIQAAERQGSDCTGLRELYAELEDWRQWRESNDLPASWDR